MSADHSIVPPSFTYFGATYNESNDFDFGVLSDYLFDDDTFFKVDKAPLASNAKGNKSKHVKFNRDKSKKSSKQSHRSSKYDNNLSDINEGHNDCNDNENNNDNDDVDDDDDDDDGRNDISEDDFSDDQNGGNGKRKKGARGSSLSKSKDQIDRRRERNRVLARKTRYEAYQRRSYTILFFYISYLLPNCSLYYLLFSY